MEYVNFYPKTYHTIKSQDNPVYGDKECLIIVREFKIVDESKRYVVLWIKPNSDPTKLRSAIPIAVFWKEYVATQFCQLFTPENL